MQVNTLPVNVHVAGLAFHTHGARLRHTYVVPAVLRAFGKVSYVLSTT